MGKKFMIILWIILFLAIIVLAYLFIGISKTNENITWGVNFSQKQTESLEIDWKDTYSAIINDLGAKNIKLHVNWNNIEKEKGKYSFEDIDWQLNLAKAKGVKIIYVLGLKSGRWPECHIPLFSSTLSKEDQQKEILSYIETSVERYKDNKAIAYWQVENEPFFRFGKCPSWYYKDRDFLRKEVELVKSLDPSRKIIISDSGEFSPWISVSMLGDVVGVTTYREAWIHIIDGIGFYFKYFFPPVFYERRALLVDKIFNKKVIGIELQAEPWTTKAIPQVPLEELNNKMNPKKFNDNISYAKKTGIDTFYFWGAEWWYWMKEVKQNTEMWNSAKDIFKN